MLKEIQNTSTFEEYIIVNTNSSENNQFKEEEAEHSYNSLFNKVDEKIQQNKKDM